MALMQMEKAKKEFDDFCLLLKPSKDRALQAQKV